MKKSPNFSNPPVDEVAMGFSFQPSAHIELLDVSNLWEEFQKKGFDDVQTHAPIASKGSRVFQNFNLQLKSKPDFPRFWFIKKTKEYIVQVQEDKFLINWRFTDEPTKRYIGFEKIEKNFWIYAELFAAWFEEKSGEKLKIKNLELSYYNTIEVGPKSLVGMFKDFQWSTKSILSNAVKQMFFEVTLPVEKIDAEMYILGHTGKKRDAEGDIFRLELAVTGKIDAQGLNKKLMKPWYNLSHDKIVHGFVELTTPKMHKQWGYKNG